MSYIMFRQQCLDCLKEWNASFGIVDITPIGSGGCNKCPHCGSDRIKHAGQGWRMEDGNLFPDYANSAWAHLEKEMWIGCDQ